MAISILEGEKTVRSAPDLDLGLYGSNMRQIMRDNNQVGAGSRLKAGSLQEAGDLYGGVQASVPPMAAAGPRQDTIKKRDLKINSEK